MNQSEIEKQIAEAQEKVTTMKADIERLAVELSAASTVAIISRIVLLERDIKEFKSMLDFLEFEEITKGF
jgi:hypothetical protein